MSTFRLHTALLSSAVTALLPLGAAAATGTGTPADSADAAAAADQGAIVVTGVREEETVLPQRPAASIYGIEASVLDTPRSLSQVNAAQLLHDPLASTDDFVKYAPGITRGGGQGNSAAPSLRGLASEVFQNGQRIYKEGNDHPLNLNAFEGADIVAGPSSVIFGPSSQTGGYINYVTKKPFFDKQHTQVTAGIGTWTPGDDSFQDVNLTLDTGGPVSDKLAYRISIKGQRGGTYYANVENNYNSFYGALSWRPTSTVRVDWNGSFDNYYDYNITRGWNRPTQALVDSFGKEYYAGRATPLINSPGVGIWSPVFASSNPTAAPVGWQTRTRNAQAQYIPGTVRTTPLPSSTLAGAGTIVGWVYDPTIPGNEAKSISASTGSGRPEDRNRAKRYISQLQVGVDLSDRWNILWSGFYQRSTTDNDSVGSFLYRNRSTLFDSRFEIRGKIEGGELFGLPLELQSNSGVAVRLLKYSAKSANNNFNYNPYDLTLDPSTITPSALYGLPLANPNASGSWIGAPGVPQLSPYFGYLNLPVMVSTGDGFYSEIGGFPTSGGAVYTSAGHINQHSFFTQQNIRFGDAGGINLGVNVTQISADISNPVTLTAAQQRSDKRHFTLPSYQASVYVKPTVNSTLYFTYDHSVAVNTGVFGSFNVWGAGNKLNPAAFNSVSELYEGGFKADLIPNKLFTSTSVFLQYRDTSPDTNGNIARVRIKGVESSLRYQPDTHFAAGVNFTYLDAVNTYIVPAGFSPFGFYADNATVFGDSNRLNGRTGGRYGVPGVPKYSLNGFADYHFDNGLGAELAAWYTGKFYTNLSQSVVVPDGYQANLTLYYRRPRYDVAVKIVNLTNQHNFLNALTGGEFLQPLPPRAVQAQFSLRF